ncbi:MAG TPA: hypothetical protein PL082_09325 [Tepidiformaceae bacterium]|jgi:hypothetical protein|nr:hypothetical protein [Tepidiformaceae bacterium]
MKTHRVASLVVFLLITACAKPADEGSVAADAVPAAGEEPVERAAPVDFGRPELEGYERGIVEETERVVEAEGALAAASTPEGRAKAAQAKWEDATIPEGAEEAGIPEARYREVRAAIHRAFETMDYQGKIDGPMELDTALATPEMKGRLTEDPFGHLTPTAAAGLKGRLDRLVPLWIKYVRLTVASY